MVTAAKIEWKSSTKLVTIKIPESILKDVLKFAEELDNKKNSVKRARIQHTPEQLAKLSPEQLNIYNSMLGYSPLGARQYAENALRILEGRCIDCGNNKIRKKDENGLYICYCLKCIKKEELAKISEKQKKIKKSTVPKQVKRGKRLSLNWKEFESK